jgi:hypothetical protein
MRRRIEAKIMFLMIVLGFAELAFSFNINNFLYPNENASMVSYENFTINNVSYSLIKINGKEAILLKNGREMTNETEIRDVIYTYYKSEYYPTQAELDNIKNKVEIYNKSRYDGPQQEEAACMAALHIDGKTIIDNKPVTCVDDKTCEFAAEFTYKQWYSGAFENSQKYLAAMKPLALAMHGTTAILKTALEKIDSATEDTLYDALVYLKTSIPLLKKYKDDIEKSVLTKPPTDICPPLDLNETALDKLENDVTAVVNKMAPFANYKNASSYIASTTKERIEFYVSEVKAEYYRSVFEPLKNSAEETIEKVTNLSKFIVNKSLKTKVEILNQLYYDINKSISERNFTKIDDDLEEFKTLINATDAGIKSTAEFYNQSLNKRSEVIATLIVLGSKEIGGDNAIKFEELLNKSKQLDEKFKKGGITVEEHLDLMSAYTNISNELNEIKKSGEENAMAVVINNFKLASYKAADELLDTVKKAQIVKDDSIASNIIYIIGGFSFLTFISLSSLFMLVAIIALRRKAITPPRVKLYAIGSFALLVLSFIFSALLYYFMDKATKTNDIEVWLNSFRGSDRNISIVLNVENLSTDDVSAMRQCAALLSSSIEQANMNMINKSVTMYQLSDTCKILQTQLASNETSNKTQEVKLNKTECVKAMADTDIINFKYSPTDNAIRFPALIDKNITVIGDADWYNVCAISKIFRW